MPETPQQHDPDSAGQTGSAPRTPRCGLAAPSGVGPA
ncbi:Uncharacterised protein [Rothia kristinae]|nr:Uncharacterised protein [Rothia kristinae]